MTPGWSIDHIKVDSLELYIIKREALRTQWVFRYGYIKSADAQAVRDTLAGQDQESFSDLNSNYFHQDCKLHAGARPLEDYHVWHNGPVYTLYAE